jgi:hypothetical protein
MNYIHLQLYLKHLKKSFIKLTIRMISDRAKAEALKIREELRVAKGVACTGYMPSRRSRRSKEGNNLSQLSFGKNKSIKKSGVYSKTVHASNRGSPGFLDSIENNDNDLFSDNDAVNKSVGAIEEDEEEMLVGLDIEDNKNKKFIKLTIRLISNRAKVEALEELSVNKTETCTDYMPSRRSRRSKEGTNLSQLSFGKKKSIKKSGVYSITVHAANGGSPGFLDSIENYDNDLFSDNDAVNKSAGAIEDYEEEMLVGIDNEDISYLGASELDNVNTDILEGIILGS